MKIGRTVGTKGGYVAQELDGLKFAAEFQFQNIGDGEVVASGKSQRLQRGIVQVGIGRRKAAHGQPQRGRRNRRPGDCE